MEPPNGVVVLSGVTPSRASPVRCTGAGACARCTRSRVFPLRSAPGREYDVVDENRPEGPWALVLVPELNSPRRWVSKERKRVLRFAFELFTSLLSSE